MIIDLHVLQNFAPSNLNRDETGAPKECEFGGQRRARISSQSFKRAIRTQFRASGLIDPAHLAERTKRAAGEITQRVVAAGKPPETARQVVEALLGAVRLDVFDGKTRYLLFLSARELQAAADLCVRHWDTLTEAIGPGIGPGSGSDGGGGATQPEEEDETAGAAGTATRGRRGARASEASRKGRAIPAELRSAFERLLDGGQAVDMALFGRMIADLPDRNVEAACQVAHALSTHRVSMEFDFFTAVDDLRPDDTAGADMLGTVEYTSACFYRYANLDTRQLAQNLRNDTLARAGVESFLRAFVTAIPSGHQHSMAAHNPPSFVLAVARDRGQWNLANAFLTPVLPRSASASASQVNQMNLMQASIQALATYWSRLSAMYPTPLAGVWLATTEPEALGDLAPQQVPSLDALIAAVLTTVEREGGLDATAGDNAAGAALGFAPAGLDELLTTPDPASPASGGLSPQQSGGSTGGRV
ncbi:MAG TPA: type I-E CRISPR-associated protein Cas7/Cse4/CasC [Ktedonobacterales bacterium]|nr:type I-E CRISPR-associated protein Cas7/Cse4/CasC [Ktedonobacterales bacterium]